MTSADDVLRHVDQLWSVLNDLSENDPAAYRRFIEKQMKEGADFCSPPEVRCSLRTELLGPRKGCLYINICSWKRVPAPQDPSTPLPVCAGKLETHSNEGQGCYTLLDVALNPAVICDSGKENTEVCMLALRFAQKQCGLTLSQEYTVVGCSPKSSPEELYRRLGFQQKPNACKQPVTVSQTPAALLQQISSLNTAELDVDLADQIICKTAENKSKDLIQVLSSTYAQPQKPEHQLEVKTSAAGVPLCVKLTVELPKVCSVSDCQLNISKDDILLEVEDLYYLLLEFPNSVNEDTASAIFNKKKHRLTVTVDASD